MINLQLSAATTGQLLSTASILTLLVLMTFMSIRLKQRYRNHRVYKLLNTAIAFAAAHQTLTLYLALTEQGEWAAGLNLSALLLQALSIIIINFVVLELYTRPRRFDYYFFVTALLLAIVISAFRAISHSSIGLLEPGYLLLNRLLSLDLFLIIFHLLCLQIILPRVGQRVKYTAGLWVSITAILAVLTNEYSFGNMQPILSTLGNLLPVIYYTLLFMLLFEWVIERLQSVYVSSITDGLTGMYNRQHFNRKSQNYLDKGYRLSFLFCDIDNFKRLNDTKGHHFADGVLKQVASIVIDETEGIGVAGRYGGEELVAAIAHPKISAMQVAETIRARVEQETPITISIGCSVMSKNSTINEAVKQADEAMYQSKTTGKNKVTLHKNRNTTARTAQAAEITQELVP